MAAETFAARPILTGIAPERKRARRVLASLAAGVGVETDEIAAVLGIATGAVRRLLTRPRDLVGESPIKKKLRYCVMGTIPAQRRTRGVKRGIDHEAERS